MWQPGTQFVSVPSLSHTSSILLTSSHTYSLIASLFGHYREEEEKKYQTTFSFFFYEREYGTERETDIPGASERVREKAREREGKKEGEERGKSRKRSTNDIIHTWKLRRYRLVYSRYSIGFIRSTYTPSIVLSRPGRRKTLDSACIFRPDNKPHH